MKKKDAMKWVEALRSGEYEQGINKLKTNDGKFCCLGVLNEIFSDLNLNGDDYKSSTSLINGHHIGLNGSRGLLRINWNDTVIPSIPWTATYERGPKGDEYEYIALDQLNDSGHYSFDEIADIIQWEYVEGL